MKLKLTLCLAFVFSVSLNVFGQIATAKTDLPSAAEILAKYTEAIGGRTANEKIKTRSTKGTLEMSPMGIKGTYENYAAAPDKSYTKINLQGVGEIIDAYDGANAWWVNPIQGNSDEEGEQLIQTKLASVFNREINLDKLYPRITVKGVDKVGDRDVYVLSATPAGTTSETFYFDTQTGLLLRSDAIAVSPEGKSPISTFYDDYREVDGVKLPYKIRVKLPQFEMMTTITEVKQNVPLDDSQFAKPKQ